MTTAPLAPSHASARAGTPSRVAGGLTALPWVLAVAGVLVQMAFPLTGGGTLALTVASVVLFSGAALADALVRFGPAVAASVLVGVGGVGLVAEAVGVRTGVPFGGYDYTGTLGAEVLGVPVLVPLAWVMMAWPALAVARRLVHGSSGHRAGRAVGLVTVLVGAWALTAWDVFLDPQMVDAGHWAWDDPTPSLPGVDGIPLSNFAGWLLVSVVVVGLLDRVVPRAATGGGRASDAVPLTVYLWTYGSSVLAHAVFFGRPSVALVGALVMGLVALPLARSLWRARSRPTRRARRSRR